MAVVGIAGTLALAGCGGDSSAEDSPKLASSIKDACALGDKEKAVNWWRSGDEADLREEIAPFEKEHPDIKITIGLYRPNEIVQRMSAEMQAGKKPGADVVDGDLLTLDPLFQQGWIQDYDWAAAGTPEEHITEVNGAPGVRNSRTYIGLAYNTDVVPAAEVPKTYQDLIDSKWAGKVVYDPRGTYLQGTSVVWGPDKAIAWFDDLLDTTKAVPIEGGTASIEAVVQGQYAMTTSASQNDAQANIDSGAPLGFQLLDVIPVNDYNTALIKGAEHPNAAACFLEWWTGPEGEAGRLKVEGKSNAEAPADMPAGSELAVVDTQEDFDAADKMVTHIAESSQ
ncbi:ABC transporter substrate-binding protein [Nocardioides halotolerans]|uniref:ABC transporter substrate-binding protein n=1 Tax=Nocardioides halotolerans TaxID=433660 RepID=UPI00146EA2B0|nr:extracellular solute-binding protein [Nocardioides halotolerans]